MTITVFSQPFEIQNKERTNGALLPQSMFQILITVIQIPLQNGKMWSLKKKNGTESFEQHLQTIQFPSYVSEFCQGK